MPGGLVSSVVKEAMTICIIQNIWFHLLINWWQNKEIILLKTCFLRLLTTKQENHSQTLVLYVDNKTKRCTTNNNLCFILLEISQKSKSYIQKMQYVFQKYWEIWYDRMKTRIWNNNNPTNCLPLWCLGW